MMRYFEKARAGASRRGLAAPKINKKAILFFSSGAENVRRGEVFFPAGKIKQNKRIFCLILGVSSRYLYRLVVLPSWCIGCRGRVFFPLMTGEMGTQVPGGTSAGEQSRRLSPAPPQRRLRLSYPRGRSPRKKPRAESAKTSAAARGGAQGGARPTRQPPQPAAAGKARAARGERSERRPAGRGRLPTASAGDRGNAAGGGERQAQPDRADPERAGGARRAEGAPERRASPAAKPPPGGAKRHCPETEARAQRGAGAEPTAARPRKKRRWDAEPGGEAAARLPRRGRLHKPPQRRREAEKRPRHRARDAATAGAPSTTEARERPKGRDRASGRTRARAACGGGDEATRQEPSGE